MVGKYLRDFIHLLFLILTAHLTEDGGGERIYPLRILLTKTCPKKRTAYKGIEGLIEEASEAESARGAEAWHTMALLTT